jgi:hypothetical protein
VFAVL